tara:strand:- start:25753 stop:26073 length:321 start_codon:yes stop_codon:yes gene_type:complete
MKTIKDKSTGNNNTLDVLDHIQEVKVSPFFKNKVLNRMNQPKEEKASSLGWFTPQLQLATLVVVICINVTTIYYSFSEQNSQQNVSSFDSFIKDYNLDSNTTIFIN